MTDLFLKLLNMSITASWVVLAVMLLRLVCRKTPRYIICLLWGLVALRLLIPVTWESAISLIPSAEVIPQNIVSAPAIQSGIPAINGAVNPILGQQAATGVNYMEQILQIASIVWLVGVGILLVYNAVSYWMLHWRVQASFQLSGNVYVCDHVQSPFILGIFFPKIYMPSGMDENQIQYVLAHERAHIQRKDHWWKPLGFFLLTVYWFNPLLWVAYILLCRDIERACDEKVIAPMDDTGKKGYSHALIACSAHRRMVMACPVAFGEVGVKERIKGVLNYKKPAFWVVLASVAVCLVASVCLLTNPEACLHDYVGIVTANASCTHEGVETFTCQKCQYCYTESVAVHPHNYQETAVLAEPSCVEYGTQELRCVDCGAVTTQKIEKTAHIAGEPYFVTEPNCTETGTEHATCIACHIIFLTQVLETNDVHELQDTVVKEPTCAEAGEGAMVCIRCDYAESYVIDQLEHHYGSGFVAFGATCMKEGAIWQGCLNCDAERYVTTPKTDHFWSLVGPFGMKYCTFCHCMKYPDSYYNSEDSSVIFDLVQSSNTPRPDGNGWTPDQPIVWDPN